MRFPDRQEGILYLTEGMFTLLDKPAAMPELHGMYQRYLDVAARHGFVALMGGLDYRASPDWAGKLGYSAGALSDAQLRAIEFLREVSRPYRSQRPDILYVGIVGPRGDANALNRTFTAPEAEDYHSVQVAALRRAKVDLVSAMTLNSVEEAVGISRAVHAADLPLSLSFTLDSTSRLKSGPSSVKLSRQWMIERAVLDQTVTESTAPIRSSSNRPSNRGIGYFAYAACARTRRRWTRSRCANSAVSSRATHANLAARWENWRGDTRTLTCGAGAAGRGKRILTRSPNTSGLREPSS